MFQNVPICFNVHYIKFNTTFAKGAVYRFMTGCYHDGSGLGALMIVSRLPYIVILQHDLLLAHYEYAIVNICIFTE